MTTSAAVRDVVACTSLTRIYDAAGDEIIWTGGNAGHVSDVQGREYVDFVCGLGPVVVGHSDPEWLERFGQRLSGGLLLPGYASVHRDYAERVLEQAPAEFASVGFFKHSSDAVSAAVRLARYRTGRPAIIRCGYTGWHDALIASSPRWHEPLKSPSRDIIRSAPGCAGVRGAEAPWDWTDLEPSSLAEQLRTGRYAALIVDAYQLALRTDDWLRQGMDQAARHGTMVILDETKTAGRVSPLGALGEFHPEADYLVLGKAIANGVPLSILLGRAGMTEDFDVARITGTFSKDLTSVYAALTTWEVMTARNGYSRLAALGTQVCERFRQAAEKTGTVQDVDAVPLFGGGLWEIRFGPTVVGDVNRRADLISQLQGHGVLALQGHPSYVCLAHEADLTDLGRRFERALTAWTDRG